MTDATILQITDGRAASDAAYERERAELVGNTPAEAGVHWGQDIARLIFKFSQRPGWTVRRLSEKEKALGNKGASATYIQYKIAFGKFLAMFTNCEQTEIPTWLPHLSEGRYRKYWEMTKDALDEEARFREVTRLLNQSEDRRTKHTNEIGVAIRAKFMDGKWHSPATIAKAIGHPEAEIIDTLDRAVSRKSGNITYLAERAHRRRGVYEYRMFSKEKTISTMVLTEKLAPIIKTLRTQGKTNMATVSIAAIAFAGSELQALLDEWSQ